jgi:beta-phosphoglucomutase-like phosphatase (HAD superfamily)
MISAVAYDLEGTVVDVEYAHHQGHILAAADAGVELTLEDCFRLIPHFIGGPDDAVAKDIVQLATAKGNDVAWEQVLVWDRKHYNELLTTLEIKPRPGFTAFFNYVGGLLLPQTIGSLTNQDQAMVLLERSELLQLFGIENIVLREHVKEVKPAPDVWYETARRARIRPEAQLVFEDSPKGIAGAVQVGAYGIGMPVYNRPDTNTALINAGVRRIFHSWEEINPQALLRNVQEEHGK